MNGRDAPWRALVEVVTIELSRTFINFIRAIRGALTDLRIFQINLWFGVGEGTLVVYDGRLALKILSLVLPRWSY